MEINLLGTGLLGGVDVEAFMAILRASALYAPTFDKTLAKELAHDYANPNFPTAHLRKDLQLFLGAAKAAGLDDSALHQLTAGEFSQDLRHRL
jgi:3-hydroxyisobutyrate dehydrogenase